MTEPATVYEMIQAHALTQPDALAILAPGRPALTYRALGEQIAITVAALNHFGLGPNDRVAAALPTGPEAAVAFLAIAAGAVYAPLGPALTAREFTESLPVPTTKALVLPAGTITPAREVARERRIPILELVTSPESAAGTFRLTGDPCTHVAACRVAGPHDVGLVIRSSGTTTRPKVFSFSQSLLLARAQEKAEINELTAADRGLSLSLLFHTYGLNTVLGSLFAGASIICGPGLHFPEFFTWLFELQPTWYAGLPAMHQAILDQVRLAPDVITHHSLRFARSGAATLSAQLREDWEAAFGVPLIESLSSTETGDVGHTPFPPRMRKAGSIGIASPWTVVLDEHGVALPANISGALAVPEARVIRPEEATLDEFPVVNGYYLTGDVGYLDDERNLFLMGRAKELINRGGEKVAPQEVEEQLLRHPAVAQAAVFALPDPKLGQEVAAAVVLRAERRASEDELRAFVAPRLAHYKVPRVILIVDQMPVNAVGKVQRLALAELLQGELDRHRQLDAVGSERARVVVPPRDALEKRLVDLWQSLLLVRPIGITDDFFALGGDSLDAVRLLAHLDVAFEVQLSEAVLSGISTIEGLADVIREATWRSDGSALVPLKRQGTRPPLFICLHADPASALEYRHLVRHTPDDQPLLGVQIRTDSPGHAAPPSIGELATAYRREIGAAQPHGPYHLLGYSAAGLVAFEVACQLVEANQTVAFLGLLDTPYPVPNGVATLDDFGPHRVQRHLRRVRALGVRASGPYLVECLTRVAQRWDGRLRMGKARRHPTAPPDSPSTPPAPVYEPRRYPHTLTLFLAADSPGDRVRMVEAGWTGVATGGCEVRWVPGDHTILLRAHDGKPLAQSLDACLQRVQGLTTPERVS